MTDNSIQAPASTSIIQTPVAREIELDFVRGVAILLAVGSHFNPESTGIFLLDLVLAPGVYVGRTGVDLFFVLSGFLVGGLVFKEYQRTGSFQARRFLVRRALKIWPILYAYLAILLITRRYEWDEFLPQVLLHVQNYFPTPMSHLWSLAVEEHFYFALSVMAAIGLRLSIPYRQLFYSTVILILVICFILRTIAVYRGVHPFVIQHLTHFRIDSLMAGVFLAYLNRFEPTFFLRLSSYKSALLFCWVSIALILGIGRNNMDFHSTAGYSLAYVMGAAFLLYCYRHPVLLRRSAFARGIAHLGTYSYAMYVYQFIGMRLGDNLAGRLPFPESFIAIQILARYACTLVVAIALTKLIERPSLALRDRLFPPS